MILRPENVSFGLSNNGGKQAFSLMQGVSCNRLDKYNTGVVTPFYWHNNLDGQPIELCRSMFGSDLGCDTDIHSDYKMQVNGLTVMAFYTTLLTMMSWCGDLYAAPAEGCPKLQCVQTHYKNFLPFSSLFWGDFYYQLCISDFTTCAGSPNITTKIVAAGEPECAFIYGTIHPLARGMPIVTANLNPRAAVSNGNIYLWPTTSTTMNITTIPEWYTRIVSKSNTTRYLNRAAGIIRHFQNNTRIKNYILSEATRLNGSAFSNYTGYDFKDGVASSFSIGTWIKREYDKIMSIVLPCL